MHLHNPHHNYISQIYTLDIHMIYLHRTYQS